MDSDRQISSCEEERRTENPSETTRRGTALGKGPQVRVGTTTVPLNHEPSPRTGEGRVVSVPKRGDSSLTKESSRSTTTRTCVHRSFALRSRDSDAGTAESGPRLSLRLPSPPLGHGPRTLVRPTHTEVVLRGPKSETRPPTYSVEPRSGFDTTRSQIVSPRWSVVQCRHPSPPSPPN